MEHPKRPLQQHQLPSPATVVFAHPDLPTADADERSIDPRVCSHLVSQHVLIQPEPHVSIPFGGTGCNEVRVQEGVQLLARFLQHQACFQGHGQVPGCYAD